MSGSELTAAWLMITTPSFPAGAEFILPTTVTIVLAPMARLPTGHVTTTRPVLLSVACEHVAGAAADTKLMPVGNVSTTFTCVAGFGPTFVAVILYVTVLPKATGCGVMSSFVSAIYGVV